MADREAKLTFRAETAEFREAITKANSSLKNLRSEVRLADAQMDAAGVSVDALKNKDMLLRKEQDQLRSKVDALTAQHRKAIEVYGANSKEAQRYGTQLNNTRTALAQCESRIKANNTALQSAERAEREADTALAALNRTIATNEQKMSQLGDRYREAVVQFGANSKETRELENEMRVLNKELQEDRRIVQAADAAYENLSNELGLADSNARRASDGFTVVKGTLAHLGSTVLQNVVTKLKDVSREVINLGVDFETSMAKVQALSGATADEYASLESLARQLGSSTRFTASQVADGFGYMALAGWDCQSMMDGIPGILNLAAASEMDLAKASDIVTDYLTAFGLTAKDSEKFVDQMTFAMANSNTNVEQLGEAYKGCAATAASMNYSVEDTTAALMVMANAGVKGSEAGTALNAIMTRLATDTKGCATELGKYGVQVYDAQGNMQSLSSILQSMGDVWENLTDQQQASMAKAIAGTNHYANLQTIMGGVSKAAKEGGQGFVGYTQALENCSGSAQKMSDIMMNTAQGDLYTMQSALEETGLKVYEKLEQPFRSAIQFITGPGVSGITWLIDNLRVLPPLFAGIVAAFVQLKSKAGIWGILQSGAGKVKAAFDTSRVSVNRLSRDVVAGEVVWKKYNATTGETTIVTGRSTASLRIQQGALKAQALATKGATVAAKGLSTALKTIAPIAAISLITEGLMRFSQWAEDASEKEGKVKKATDGLRNSSNSYNEAQRAVLRTSQEASDSAEDYAGSLKTVAEMATEAREHQAELADSLSESWADVGTKNAMVDQYVDTIDRLAGNTADSAEKQGELQAAVDGLNEIMGTSYTVVDKQNGVLSASTGAIKANAAAWQQKALAEAASAAQSDLMKQHIENQTAIAAATDEWKEAQENLNNATNDFESAMYAQRVRDTKSALDELEKQDKECTDEMERMNSVIGQLGNAYASAPDAIKAYIDSTESVSSLLSDAGINADDFASSLSDIGISTEDLAAMTPELLASLVEQYQSDIGGLAQWCAEHGVEIPGNLAAGIEQGNADVQQAGQQNVDQYRETVQVAAAGSQQDGANLAGAAADGASTQGSAWQQAAQSNVGQYTATVSMATGEVVAAGAAYASASGDAAVQAAGQGGAEAGEAQIESHADAIESGQSQVETSSRNAAQAAAKAADIPSEFYQSGRNDVQGLINGADSLMGALREKGREMARKMLEGLREQAQESSPWKTTIRSGRYAIQGLMVGEDQETPNLVRKSKEIARETVDALSPEALGFAWQLEGRYLGAATTGSLSIAEMSAPMRSLQNYLDSVFEANDRTSEVVDAIEKLADIALIFDIDGRPFAKAVAGDLDSVSGQRQELVERGIEL